MQPNEYIKNKARKLAKQTWAGPGKFGVFILICIFIVATFESLGLSNREKNLEMRTIQNIVIPVSLNSEKVSIAIAEEQVKYDLSDELFLEKLKLSANVDCQRKAMEIENILIYGAVDQYLYEHKNVIDNYSSIISQFDKTQFFMSLLFKKTEEFIVDISTEEFFFLDI